MSRNVLNEEIRQGHDVVVQKYEECSSCMLNAQVARTCGTKVGLSQEPQAEGWAASAQGFDVLPGRPIVHYYDLELGRRECLVSECPQ
jgi:hypothetical protein